MDLNLAPVDVSIIVETPTVTNEAFYNLCFITENDVAPRTLEVKRLNDLLDNGYMRLDLAYNFCLAVLLQENIGKVYVRAKRSGETYQQAFDADDNSNYYYIVIDSKDENVILNFNDYLVSADPYKLQFFSSYKDLSSVVTNRKIVYYYEPFNVGEKDYVSWDTSDNVLSDSYDKYYTGYTNELYNYYANKSYGVVTATYYSDGVNDYWDYDDNNNVLWDSSSNVLLERQDIPPNVAQSARIAYPEASWIAKCGDSFPSRVQWLHKYLRGNSVHKLSQIPNLSTTLVTILDNKATTGSGMTGQGIVINEQVSLDWVTWAISKNIWNTLYTESKINANDSGLTLIENKLKEVLDIAVKENIFSEYKITQRSLQRQTSNASFKFSASLVYSILNVNIEGSVYY